MDDDWGYRGTSMTQETSKMGWYKTIFTIINHYLTIVMICINQYPQCQSTVSSQSALPPVSSSRHQGRLQILRHRVHLIDVAIFVGMLKTITNIGICGCRMLKIIWIKLYPGKTWVMWKVRTFSNPGSFCKIDILLENMVIHRWI